ncbi:hypothetical protein [Empedobacter brevis]|uniref:hypothetical protein n=1 Tax=Empedobacter brevis TaxID=247 RepID=UPI00333F5142
MENENRISDLIDGGIQKEKKYRIVNSEDRLPEKDGKYYTSNGLLDFYFIKGKGDFWDQNDDYELYPNFWLEEIESYEFEMLDMLKDIIEQENISQSAHDEIINLIKQATEL